VILHRHSAIAVEGTHFFDHAAANAVRRHHDAMRKLAIEQRAGCLSSGAGHAEQKRLYQLANVMKVENISFHRA